MDGHRAIPPEVAVVYPTRDGKPMAETDEHRIEMQNWVINVLEDHFRDDPAVYVSGNNFLYFVEGDPHTCVSPDSYVIKGVEKRLRDIYKVWEEGDRVPCFVMEITSKNTRREDLGDKMAKYRDDLGVKEYFLFDPRRDWVGENLRGFALQAGVYQPIVANPAGRLPSRELGLEIGVVQGHVRFFSPGAAEPLPTYVETAERERKRAEEQRTRAEEQRTRAEEQRTRAEEQRTRAEEQRIRAEEQRIRAEAAEQEVRRLQAEIERLRGRP